MIVPDTNLRRAAPRASGRTVPVVARAVLSMLLVGTAAWTMWVYSQIEYYAHHDEAQPVDAIAVFGAAEYDGRPSPVLRARLDHGLELYRRKMAPMIITLGGGDPTNQHSEGGVGHDYLIANGIPESAIVAETQSGNTEESAERLAVIARENHLESVLAVSDGTHLFRIHALCEHDGLKVYTSPRPSTRSLPAWMRAEQLAHEIGSYTLWRLHMH